MVNVFPIVATLVVPHTSPLRPTDLANRCGMRSVKDKGGPKFCIYGRKKKSPRLSLNYLAI